MFAFVPPSLRNIKLSTKYLWTIRALSLRSLSPSPSDFIGCLRRTILFRWSLLLSKTEVSFSAPPVSGVGVFFADIMPSSASRSKFSIRRSKSLLKRSLSEHLHGNYDYFWYAQIDQRLVIDYFTFYSSWLWDNNVCF